MHCMIPVHRSSDEIGVRRDVSDKLFAIDATRPIAVHIGNDLSNIFVRQVVLSQRLECGQELQQVAIPIGEAAVLMSEI